MGNQDVEGLLELDEKDLFARLGYSHGRENAGDAVFRDPPSNVEVEAAKGRRLLDDLIPVLEKRVCNDWGACEKIRSDAYATPTDLVLAISDIIAAAVTGVPVILVSALIVKLGVRRLCECE